MIRARYSADDRTGILLGLDRTSVERMLDGQPIFVDGDAFGLGSPIDVGLVAAKTIDELASDLRMGGVPVGDNLQSRPTTGLPAVCAKIVRQGHTLLLFGFDRATLEHMVADHPIVLDAGSFEVDEPLELLIAAAETLEQLLLTLRARNYPVPETLPPVVGDPSVN